MSFNHDTMLDIFTAILKQATKTDFITVSWAYRIISGFVLVYMILRCISLCRAYKPKPRPAKPQPAKPQPAKPQPAKPIPPLRAGAIARFKFPDESSGGLEFERPIEHKQTDESKSKLHESRHSERDKGWSLSDSRIKLPDDGSASSDYEDSDYVPSSSSSASSSESDIDKETLDVGYIYFVTEKRYVSDDSRTFVKIGRTSSSVPTRLRALQCGNPRELVVHSSFKCAYHKKMEKFLHGYFGRCSAYSMENGGTEWFKLYPHEITNIVSAVKHVSFIDDAPTCTTYTYTGCNAKSSMKHMQRDMRAVRRRSHV